MLNPNSVFITGTSRGLGLEFVRQFCELPSPPKYIFATCRDPGKAKDLQAIANDYKNVKILQYDVTDFQRLKSIVAEVEATVLKDGLNLLVCNAAQFIGRSFEEEDQTSLQQAFNVNTIAPFMQFQAFLPLLRRAAHQCSEANLSCSKAAVINISTRASSISDIGQHGKSYNYRASKSALNMLTKTISVDFKSDGILAAAFCPGYTATEMGNAFGRYLNQEGIEQDPPISTVEESVKAMIKLMSELDASTSGSFLRYNGDQIQW